MCSSLVRRVITLLLAQSLFLPIASAQQQETRPRRAQPVWSPPSATTPIIAPASLTTTTGPEPTIRVALTTDARSAVISTTGHLMNASGGSTLLAMDTSRVRVDPRLLSPRQTVADDATFRVIVGGAASREEAEENEKEIQKAAGEDAHTIYDTETKTWGMVIGTTHPREEAEEIRARLEAAGFDATVEGKEPQTVTQTQAPASNSSSVRLTSRSALPSREVVTSSTTGPIFSSSAPVSFASDDEQNAPVRFNEKAYRGRIEVFTNLRGNLTVVNELGLEDYVRGVVANELSPGGYPAIEALKAQAIAARTYALKNRGQFMSQGFDILPTTRSQVYRGLTSENPLSTRAVDETRGLIATYNGEPINALYTSTCGGRTEDSEKIFNEAIPYLRARECAAEGATFDRFVIKTSREPADLQDDANVLLVRDVSLLFTQNFGTLRERVSDSWLSGDASVGEVRNWLANVARVARQAMPVTADDVNRPAAFATALSTAVFGESRAGTLLNDADADYLLAVKDASEVPAQNRADLAMLLRDGHLSVYPDATLRPRMPLSRARVLHAMSRLLEARNLLQLQKGNARPTSDGQLILRSTKGKDQPIRVNPDAFLFRYLGERPYAVSSVALVGGEPVNYHLAPNGQIDFLEVRPAPNGAAADRMSPFANWTKGLSVAQVQARLARAARGIGSIVDLRVVSRGASHRVTDLEIVGTSGTAHVRGGRIRSALGLREQLFVIDREYDDAGRVAEFTFVGRGWGHGVGMCQVGAYGLAKQGWTSEQILKAYYSGIEITRMY
ncbi:MAG TPA: SpoIID/LytB domain-containing protein [Pyrinomonadaceae bacterium]